MENQKLENDSFLTGLLVLWGQRSAHSSLTLLASLYYVNFLLAIAMICKYDIYICSRLTEYKSKYCHSKCKKFLEKIHL